MSLELINTLAAVGTLVIIAVTAVAALVQLRHLSSSNQLAGLLHTVKVYEAPEFQRDLSWMKFSIADLWEQTGVYIKYGLVSEEAFMDLAGGIVLVTWDAISEVIRIRREVTGDAMYENFEYLAARAAEWQKRHATNYPAGTPRMLPRTPQ